MLESSTGMHWWKVADISIHKRVSSETRHVVDVQAIARLTGLGISLSLYSKTLTTLTYTSYVTLT